MNLAFRHFVPALWLLIGAGCATFEEGVRQEVLVVSFPSGAEVILNGESVGRTPLKLNLPRMTNHEVRLEKEGYKPEVRYFTPVPLDEETQMVRFGLMDDLGYYYDLSPEVMSSELESRLVPESAGVDPFARMAQQALEADRMLEAGEITPAEHKVIIEQIITFFEVRE